MFREAGELVGRAFGALSTALLLAVIVTVPIAQFFALGWLLHAAGRYAQTGKFSAAFVGVGEASRIGQFLLGSWLVSLPLRLVVSLRQDAALIDPASPQVASLTRLGYLLAALAVWIVLAALSQGGTLPHFARPLRATLRLVRQLRAGGYRERASSSLRTFLAGFQIPKIFSLGLRGYLGAAAWLLVPTTLIVVGRTGVLALIGGTLLVAVLLYLPFLQIHFAVHDRLRRMFDLDGVRYTFARAPVAFWLALLSTLLLALPLYLLKIELVPRDALWLPSALFVLTIFPCKLLAAWAYHRGAKRGDRAAHGVWIWAARLGMIPVAVFYAFIVFLTQYTGWHGVLGLYEHHAFLLPVPF